MTDYVYAVVNDDGIVDNIVASDNPEAVDVLRMLIPDAHEIVLATDETGPAYINGDLIDGKFRMPSPYPSWIWDQAASAWFAPIPYPEGGTYVWDENATSWVPVA